MENNKELVTAQEKGKMRVICLKFSDDTRGVKAPHYTYRSSEDLLVNEVIKLSNNKQAIVTKIIDVDAKFMNTMTGEFRDKITGIHDVELKELVLFKEQANMVQYFQRF